MDDPEDGRRRQSTVFCSVWMAGLPSEADHGEPQHVENVVLDVGMLDRAADVETTNPLQAKQASSSSGERRDHEIAPVLPQSSGGDEPSAAPASSQGAFRDPLEDRMAREMEEVRGSGEHPCIWRVHPSIREQESEAYEPKLVSIGPLHRGKKSLLHMEEIKLRYVNDLLRRNPHANKLSNYIRVIRDCERQARKQYAEEVDLTEEEFVRMLVLDGCFIIEYFVKRVFNETNETAQLASVRWGFALLRRDLMLLENQLPFFVLVKLFEQTNIPFIGTLSRPLNLMDITLGFLKIKMPEESRPSVDQLLHLIHLHHLCLDPSRVAEVPPQHCSFGDVALFPFKKAVSLVSLVLIGLLYLLLVHRWPWHRSTERSEVPRMIPCAAELRGAGIKLKRKERVSSFLNVSFKEGTLEIPFLPVEESTSSKLRNFIALEQCCPQVGSHFTSYAVFMDNIINTESDVAVLRKYKIIESKLGSDEEVAKVFNTLCKGTHLNYKKHYNASLFKDVKEYCEFAHHMWRAILVGKYFGNPWSMISLVAGGLLLFLSAVQTYLTAFPRK